MPPMKTMKAPVLDRQKKTITVTKEFLIHAGQFGTQEFNILTELKQTFPDFEVMVHTIARNDEKHAYGGLTYPAMTDFIKGHEDDEKREAALAEFKAIQKVAKTMRGSYALVKKWFLDKYGKEFKTYQDEQNAKKRAATQSHLLYTLEHE